MRFNRYTESGWISTHTPLAGRDAEKEKAHAAEKISTHTPLAGRDVIKNVIDSGDYISTHTPLAGRDNYEKGGDGDERYFYSHAPRGARQRCIT